MPTSIICVPQDFSDIKMKAEEEGGLPEPTPGTPIRHPSGLLLLLKESLKIFTLNMLNMQYSIEDREQDSFKMSCHGAISNTGFVYRRYHGACQTERESRKYHEVRLTL